MEQLGLDLTNVVGDALLAAATIAYSGPFTPLYRTALLAEWTAALKAAGVPSSPGANLLSTLQVRSPPVTRAAHTHTHTHTRAPHRRSPSRPSPVGLVCASRPRRSPP